MADGEVRITAVVLAAGSGSRFGGAKLLAGLAGRPILQHVLDTIAQSGLDDVVVVLGDAAADVEAAIAWRGERRVVNPDPAGGLAGSLRIGMRAVDPSATAALVVLGDQPRVAPATIRALRDATPQPGRTVVVPRYRADRGRNPVLLHRPAFGLVQEAQGDRGLGPVLVAHPGLVHEVPMNGHNPDVDTRADLVELAEAAWAERVRANREQVDRLREVPDGKDFYAPVTGLFRADPRRTDEALLEVLRGLVVPGETWLDIGAGAGRYALPLALLAARVVAVDPSRGMLDALREGMTEHGIINVDAIEGRWPDVHPRPSADVALIAHVGYDIEGIGTFIDAMEAAASRLCVAVLMERQPASLADPCWPLVHGEARNPLPALPEFVDLLRARGRDPEVRMMEREARRFASRDDLESFLRRQLWVAEDGAKDAGFRAAVDALAIEDEGGVFLRGLTPMGIGLVTWASTK